MSQASISAGPRIDIPTLEVEMFVRRWKKADLARAAGIRPNTVTALFNGRPITPQTAGKIADALVATPADEELRKLLVK